MNPELLLKEISSQLEFIEKNLNKAYWDFSINGTESLKQKLQEWNVRKAAFLSNKELFQKIEGFRNNPIDDPIIKNQIEKFYNLFLINQTNDMLMDKLIKLETEITSKFVNHRPQICGKKVSTNEIYTILRYSSDSQRRKAAYTASKQIGKEIAPLLIEMVKLRNEAAQNLGYEDFFSLAVKTQEIDLSELFKILDHLKEKTHKPFLSTKQKIDYKLARNLNLNPQNLMPWHYNDPFFQEPPGDDIDLDRYLITIDILEICNKYFNSIGFDVSDILKRSDLYEKDGKNQHAFCIHIDRSGDIRVLCNITKSFKWLSTLLHELGHAVFDKHIDYSLPYILRTPGHMFLTEAIAIMFGNQTLNPHWLQNITGIHEEIINTIKIELYNKEQVNTLVFLRWCLVMVYFERELYKNPDRNLNQLWWDLVEEIQLLQRPEETEAEWASKIHLSSFPVYYHNYILGYLAAYQIEAAIKEKLGISQLFNNPDIGNWLKKEIFQPGAKDFWNDLLKKATDHYLTPDFVIRNFE